MRIGLSGSSIRDEKRTPNARDYVQNGLIGLWDGIENSGWGIHNDNCTIWKDLIGNIDAVLVNVVINENNLYFEKHVGYTDTNFPSNYGCIEAVFSKNDSDTYSILKIDEKYSGFGICSAPYGEAISDSNDSEDGPRFVFYDNEVNTITMNKSGKTTISAYQNSLVVTDIVGAGWRYANDGHGIGGTGGREANINFYCLRIYSRNLTTTEVIKNYNIDKIRFNLT